MPQAGFEPVCPVALEIRDFFTHTSQNKTAIALTHMHTLSYEIMRIASNIHDRKHAHEHEIQAGCMRANTNIATANKPFFDQNCSWPASYKEYADLDFSSMYECKFDFVLNENNSHTRVKLS